MNTEFDCEQAASIMNISTAEVQAALTQTLYEHERSKPQIINYKPGFQWVKFRVAYNGIAQHSNEVTAILNAYKAYAENKHKAKRVSA